MSSIDEKVERLDVATTDLARLVSQSRLKLGENEQRMIEISEKMEDGHKNIIAALSRLQESQNVHMARSDEKFTGQGKTLDRLVDRFDEQTIALASNNQLTETLRNHTASLFKRADQTDKDVATCMTSHNVSSSKSSFIDSPNLRYVIMPIIIILLGLFGLAGFNMMGAAETFIGVSNGE